MSILKRSHRMSATVLRFVFIGLVACGRTSTDRTGEGAEGRETAPQLPAASSTLPDPRIGLDGSRPDATGGDETKGHQVAACGMPLEESEHNRDAECLTCDTPSCFECARSTVACADFELPSSPSVSVQGRFRRASTVLAPCADGWQEIPEHFFVWSPQAPEDSLLAPPDRATNGPRSSFKAGIVRTSGMRATARRNEQPCRGGCSGSGAIHHG